MSFKAKTDFFGLASGGVVITESNENKTASTAEGHNEKGDVVAFEVFGETMSPQCTYVLSADTNLSSMQCGTPIAGTGDYSGKKFTLGGLTINTTAGSPPSIQASGEEIPSGTSHSDCTYTFPSATLKMCHHAQILWSAFTLGGTGCYLQQANYNAGGTISRATDTKPTVTPGTDWTITAPLNCSNPDADYPSWSCTLSRYLEHDS